ncbi:hypothetical protein [Sulfitobacter alexandrii]|nr:hypothetical protein [Sulfitobacter alexandrii]
MAVSAAPVAAQFLPAEVQGSWDVSENECARTGTSITQIDISADRIDTFAGDAIVREVDRTGPVTFVAADFLQLEGAAEIGDRERTYYRLTQRAGPDRLTFKTQEGEPVDLVRCATERGAAQGDSAVHGQGPLPVPTGLWVQAGETCANPANASWRVYDGRGLFGAKSNGCDAVEIHAEGRTHVIDQTCTASYDQSRSTYRDIVEVKAPKRLGLIEQGESVMRDFNWCGPRTAP